MCGGLDPAESFLSPSPSDAAAHQNEKGPSLKYTPREGRMSASVSAFRKGPAKRGLLCAAAP